METVAREMSGNIYDQVDASRDEKTHEKAIRDDKSHEKETIRVAETPTNFTPYTNEELASSPPQIYNLDLLQSTAKENQIGEGLQSMKEFRTNESKEM